MHKNHITIDLGLPSVELLDQSTQGNTLVLRVMARAKRRRCPRCGQRTEQIHQYHRQYKQDCSLGRQRVMLELVKRRFRCSRCGKVFTEPDEACGWRRRSTRRFRAHLAQEARWQTVKRVAGKEGVSEALVRRAFRAEAQARLAASRARAPRLLGLDEFAVAKGQRYQTVLCDLEEHSVLEVVAGRGLDTTQRALDALPDAEGVEAVVMDMHEPYRQAVHMACPRAEVVADKYHVIRQVTQAMDQVRLRLQRQETKGRKHVLHRKRRLLLKGQEALSYQEREALEALFGAYPEMSRAWHLKEAFRAWYHCPDRRTAARALDQWEREALQQGPKEFGRLSYMLTQWREEILNYFDHRVTNGFVEGKNNRIKVIMRTGYGYRNMANLRLRILMTNPDHLYAAGALLHTS